MVEKIEAPPKQIKKRPSRLLCLLLLCLAALLLPAGMILFRISLFPEPAANAALTAPGAHGGTRDDHAVHFSAAAACGPHHGSSAAPAGVAVTIIFYGDVNLDSVVTVGDAILVLRSIAALADLLPHQVVAGDVNGNGVLDVNDAILILRYSAGLIDSFPVQQE
jgi:hypothetical protein